MYINVLLRNICSKLKWQCGHCDIVSTTFFCTIMKPLFHTAAFRRVLPTLYSYGFSAIHEEKERVLFNGGSPCSKVNVFRLQ